MSSVNGEAGDVTLTLDDLDDVAAPVPGDGHVLTWDEGAGEWVPAAPAGGDPITLEPEGEWDNGTTYAKLDVVSHDGSSYVGRIDDNIGHQPDESPDEWMLFAEKGEPGAGAVESVNGDTGTVVLDAGDIGVTPAGGIASTTVQGALEELDSEKEPADATILKDADIGDTVQPFDANTAKLNVENQTLSGGATIAEKDLGTPTNASTLTLDLGDRPHQKLTNNVAGFTLAPGTTIASALIIITNGASAGTITTSGWTKVVGDAFTTTNGHKFVCHASVTAAGSLLIVTAMQ